MLGEFVWYDLLTRNPEHAATFYAEVVGVRAREWYLDSDYTMIYGGNNRALGGIVDLPKEAMALGAPSHWMGYIEVADVDETLNHAEALGAKVPVRGLNIPGVGRFGVIWDPFGGIVAAFSPTGGTPRPSAGLYAGKMIWREMMAEDPEAAFGFYAALFGWKELHSMSLPNGLGTYSVFAAHEEPMGAFMTRPPILSKNVWANFLYCDKAMGTLKRDVLAAGGQIVGPVRPSLTGGCLVNCLDANGAAIGFATDIM